MKNRLIISLLIFFVWANVAAQSKKKVRVQIKNEGTTIADTTFATTNEKAEKVISEFLSSYTNEAVYINSEQIHSLYVFDISRSYTKSVPHREVEIDIDKIFDEFGHKLEHAWDDFDMEDFIDTASVRAKELHRNMQEYKASVDPELQEFKEELKEMVEKMRSTRIIIIEDGDTIRIPKKD